MHYVSDPQTRAAHCCYLEPRRPVIMLADDDGFGSPVNVCTMMYIKLMQGIRRLMPGVD